MAALQRGRRGADEKIAVVPRPRARPLRNAIPPEGGTHDAASTYTVEIFSTGVSGYCR